MICKDEEIQVIYEKWCALGWRVYVNPFKGNIDLEELIVETTHACRQDGRLLKWLLTWFRDFDDLVCKKKLIRLLKHADTAVLGAVLDIAMKNGAGQDLKTITNRCKPKRPAELLDKDPDMMDAMAEDLKKAGKKEYRKWGLYCTMIEFYDDAKRQRSWILEHNPRLATRALFGAVTVQGDSLSIN